MDNKNIDNTPEETFALLFVLLFFIGLIIYLMH